MGIEFTRTAGRLHFNGVFNKKKLPMALHKLLNINVMLVLRDTSIVPTSMIEF